jgi:hypothetical protein
MGEISTSRLTLLEKISNSLLLGRHNRPSRIPRGPAPQVVRLNPPATLWGYSPAGSLRLVLVQGGNHLG